MRNWSTDEDDDESTAMKEYDDKPGTAPHGALPEGDPETLPNVVPVSTAPDAAPPPPADPPPLPSAGQQISDVVFSVEELLQAEVVAGLPADHTPAELLLALTEAGLIVPPGGVLIYDSSLQHPSAYLGPGNHPPMFGIPPELGGHPPHDDPMPHPPTPPLLDEADPVLPPPPAP